MYCLWLNGKKVYDLQQLRASYDADAVGLYFLGGGLVRWLRDCGESHIAERVESLDPSENVYSRLAEIFGVDLPEKEEQEYRTEAANLPASTAAGSFSTVLSSFSDTSFTFGSFWATSFDTTSFAFSNTYTSFFTTSFLTTSFSAGYEYGYGSGSFRTSSFSLFLSSFFAENSLFSASFSFELSSFTLGSFSTEYGSFPLEYGSFTPETSSFHLTLSSFSPKSAEAAPTPPPNPTPVPESPSLTPQQKFELNISSCPLNRFGYGLHLI